MDHEVLKATIRKLGREANDQQQVSRRYGTFVYRRNLSQEQIAEFIEVRYQAAWSRVQYETHLMLLEARRSLQARDKARIIRR